MRDSLRLIWDQLQRSGLRRLARSSALAAAATTPLSMLDGFSARSWQTAARAASLTTTTCGKTVENHGMGVGCCLLKGC